MKRISNIFCQANRRFLVDAIIVIIPIILIYMYFNIKPAEVRQTLNDNKKIEEKIDSLRDNNNSLNDKISQLEQNQILFNDIVNRNNLLIDQNNKELVKLKRLYNGKISNVSGYNVAQLDSFFTSRYKELYNR